jgi:hypothetical protein
VPLRTCSPRHYLHNLRSAVGGRFRGALDADPLPSYKTKRPAASTTLGSNLTITVAWVAVVRKIPVRGEWSLGWRRRRGETTIPGVGRSESTGDNLWCYLRLVAASPGRNRALDHRNASPEWELSHAVVRTVGSSCRDTTHGNNTPI